MQDVLSLNLQMFVNVVRQNVNTMEDCISKAENDMGSISSFKKMFSSFVGQVRHELEQYKTNKMTYVLSNANLDCLKSENIAW